MGAIRAEATRQTRSSATSAPIQRHAGPFTRPCPSTRERPSLRPHPPALRRQTGRQSIFRARHPRARSATEAFLYRRLETLAETKGRADARVALELDGALQENGYLVWRFLAEDVGKELNVVLDAILRALGHRQSAVPITAPLACGRLISVSYTQPREGDPHSRQTKFFASSGSPWPV
jgi:hypothetical protein